MARHPGRMRSITADNGTEFQWYGQVEAVNPLKFYVARGDGPLTLLEMCAQLPLGAVISFFCASVSLQVTDTVAPTFASPLTFVVGPSVTCHTSFPD